MKQTIGIKLASTLLCALLAACAAPKAPTQAGVPAQNDGATAAIEPVQSPTDPYAYRYIVLDNGLQALLVSDPEATKAAAALNVKVGSGDNPDGRGGLAHFLEHMLFLGTDKYPDAGEYGRFISEHGGSQNAYTDFEHTNYFFDIDQQQLPGALDRFAQFFIAPRFDVEYVEREKNAVQAEYLQSLKSDGRRGLDVMQQVMNPAHPYSQIAVGTLDTLADREGSPVRDELIEFYDTWYSADRMALAVIGPQDLDALEELVREKFSAVRSQAPGAGGEDSPEQPPLFLAEELPMLVQVEPLGTRRMMQVMFPIADYRAHYDVKPSAYVGNLVGHEGKGSLLSQLKAEGLAEGLSAGSGLASRGSALFNVSVSLTEKGSAEYGRVLELLFEYLDMLRAAGAQAWSYDESAKLADLQFRFLQHGNAMGYATSLATSLHYYEPEDVLYGPYMMTRFDQEMIDALTASLTPENAVVMLTQPGVETDRVSPYYEVAYSVSRGAGADPFPGARHAASGAFGLPAPNPFIPEDVSLVDITDTFSDKPSLLLDRRNMQVWFGQDDEFRIPKGGIYVNFRSPLVASSPRTTALASMYVALLKDQLNELTYPALLAGLKFSFYVQARGISMRVSGYDDKQVELLGQLLEPMAAPDFDPQRFEDIRSRSVRDLKNRLTSRPSSQAMARLNEALLHRQWSDEEMIAAYERLQADEIPRFVQEFWSGAGAEVLLFGNYEPELADQVAGMLGQLVPDIGAGEENTGIEGNRVVKIPPDSDLLHPMEIEHDDTVVAWYLQAPGTGWEDRAKTALAAEVMKAEFFRQLRTEQQLGYTVSAFSFDKFDLPGLVMLVQSPVAGAPDVTGAMERFLHDLEGSMSRERFENHKNALVVEIQEPDKNLWERAEYYWQSMAKKRYAFDGREQMLSAISDTGYDEWLDYFQTLVSEEARSLRIVAPGKQEKLPEAQQVFEDARLLKQSFDYYEFP